MKSVVIKLVGKTVIIASVALAGWYGLVTKGAYDPSVYHGNLPKFFASNYHNNDAKIYSKESAYGAYLAARIAHMRQDFSEAAEYYKIVLEKDPENRKVNHSLYAILSSLGHIDEAAPFAQKEIDNKAPKTMAPLVLAVQDFANGNYAEAREQMNSLKDDVYTTIVAPLFNAWTYAAEKNEPEAINSLNKLIKDPQILTIKMFHAAMIYDYLGNVNAANELYSQIVVNHPADVTYRVLEVITNFYVRTGNINLARQISRRYQDNSMLSMLLADIDRKIDNAKPNEPAVINTPQKGLAEAMFNIGNIFRSTSGGVQLAQIYIATAYYLNPDYEVAKLALANILEELGLLREANRYYEQINKDSASYFISRMKMIENLNNLKEYTKAETILRQLINDYPNNAQLLSDLGNIAASMDKHREAVEIYKKAIQALPHENNENWPMFYSIAISYDKIGQKEAAEENLLKALRLSNRNSSVLNYLGYTWLVEGKNPERAVRMIMDAYRKSPYEGHIIDSLGWAYFRLGIYDKALEYLEQASDMNPGNAVISDHLGDIYWFSGRKNEAVFQWKHALVLKEDNESLDKRAVKYKIENGLSENDILPIEDEKLWNELKDLKISQE
jgi:tetratricopeptide (TPR) repeat protein